LEKALIRTDETIFRVGGELLPFQTSFYDREHLPVEEDISGPAVILQTDSTTVVPPDCVFRVEKSGAMIIRVCVAGEPSSAGNPGTSASNK